MNLDLFPIFPSVRFMATGGSILDLSLNSKERFRICLIDTHYQHPSQI